MSKLLPVHSTPLFCIKLRFLQLIFCITFLTSCATSTITIQGDIPSPLVEKLPLSLGVYYTEPFLNFTYTELSETNGEEQYIINSGASQMELFNTVLPALFQEVVILDDINAIADYPNLDLVFVPVIEEFQVGLPAKTKLDVYEIWVKYNMRLSRSDGENIADWVMTAYGKAPTETFRSVDEGVNTAAVLALRDLAASLSLGFERVPAIRDWLKNNNIVSKL